MTKGEPRSLLRCEGLHKLYGGVHALAGVDIEFPDSGIVAIIGPNGAGKTTLLNVLTGFVPPDSGRCCLGDLEMTHLVPHRIVQIGIARTFQELRLVRRLSALENVQLGRPHQRGERLWALLSFRGLAEEESRNRAEANRLLRYVGLESTAHQPAGTLSWGQQKLLSLACCLATECDILLLDEPVSGVHPELVLQILELLRRLRADGKLVVFIEHNILAVRQVADAVIVMDEGQIIAQGPPDDVLERPEILEAYLT